MVMPGREQLVDPRSGLRHRPGRACFQAAGGAAGRYRSVAGHDRKGAGARASTIICEVADLESALAAPGPAYDLILAADTLVYLGDLAAVFRAAHGRLAPDGFFLFTVEQADERDLNWVPSAAGGTAKPICAVWPMTRGFMVAGLVAATPRHEAGQPVPGFAVALSRSA